jgi:hypothetical protein
LKLKARLLVCRESVDEFTTGNPLYSEWQRS